MKNRTRLVTVRLTEAEYSRLKAHCDVNGAHSLSEYTRHHLIQSLMPTTEGSISFGHDLTSIVLRLNQLRAAMQDLQTQIDRICGDRVPPAAKHQVASYGLPD